ncbi:MAG: dihydrolipoyl dehydrogenase [Gammaproteobacteria bacterium]|nr:dihydrolipoyl dehydrogenase [Gammaproteobacteria bacterium]
MTNRFTVVVPDIGDFADVEVIEVLVQSGETVSAEQSVITLESDKATMEIPAPVAGTVSEVKIKVGDRVSKGAEVLVLETDAVTSTASPAAAAPQPASAAPAPTPAPAPAAPVAVSEGAMRAEVVVLGAGPGGYTAAFRAADLGKKVVLIERYPSLGGVCLNVGCIPSKALLHAAKVISEAHEMAEFGVAFGKPKINIDKLRGWKEKVIGQLTGGLAGLAKQRKVTVIEGKGTLVSPNELEVVSASGTQRVAFEQLIIAAGSEPTRIPGFPYDDDRLIDSTGALALKDIPKRLLVIGGGIIGLEMATVYHELGSKVTVVELMDGLMPGADRDIVKPLEKRIARQYENIYTGTKVVGITAGAKGLTVKFEGPKAPGEDTYDKVLVSVGRVPNGRLIGAENAGITVNERGFIPVDKQQRTNVPNIFAIGDIVGQPMLAHKAVHEGRVAAEVAAGEKSFFDANVIPSVAYTDPEVAWVGLTETEAKQKGVAVEKGVFPWAASGRSLSLGRNEGVTKLLFDPTTERVLGAGIVGPNAGDLIAEVALAIEMGCDAHDIGLTIHPHPTLSETVAMSAEVFSGSITDLYIPKKKK